MAMYLWGMEIGNSNLDRICFLCIEFVWIHGEEVKEVVRVEK